ncbi:hypothetical protein Psuf_051860 [Phytohabitans suffuscus]|uniref:Uncharacterized protein n=1 Tax=Phytohabitans suffuscus TaxID=624315 RepID=A0A6F8YPG7_9ACTN|nr:hypothetical protein [Phytohabitans suffuscus]BCB87873.1 hypothetical protein Psuf_051860 [Phytohabitans suffuscus]
MLAAYGTDRLDRRWQADVDLRNEYIGGECGDALCVGTLSDDGLRLIELDSGRTRWSAPGWGYSYPAGSYLLANGPGGSTTPRVVLLDPADGHLVADLGEWNASLPGPDGRMLGIRESSTRALVGRIDPVAADVEVLGSLTDVFQCHASPLAVTCRKAGGAIGIWYPESRL